MVDHDADVFKEAKLALARGGALFLPSQRDAFAGKINECREAYDLLTVSATRRSVADFIAAWSRLLVALGDDAVSRSRPRPPADAGAPASPFADTRSERGS